MLVFSPFNPEFLVASQGSYTQCAICRCHLTRHSFAPYDMSSFYYENYKEARKRVLQVYNDTRSNFKNTPEYNKYLEDCESINESRLKSIEQELRNYERNNTLRISRNIENQKSEHKKLIRSIVEKEKNFYELVDKGAPFNLWKVDEFIHPLKKSCPNYFTDETTVISTSDSKPLNAAIRNDSDIPRKVFTNRIELMESDVAGGYSKGSKICLMLILEIVFEKCKSQFDALLLWNII
ncbi:CDK-activating kinase assembly factor, putative [Theileria annulata]|uniref:CDK-activating kinase assembly factor, putative n=1 Tax=Theileria annulata TaxID=5874 RepID=Q4UEM5_THEAN|nr:CDK-activating kinase assembly factor, putative [Theileria annulata]CAI74464.1 CDK-activating kinase assembly factor, putative [Theileria annulata]|eukprot:XP_952196.1 CDK-activating kinase assembly factor, putative [Theileria annulata]